MKNFDCRIIKNSLNAMSPQTPANKNTHKNTLREKFPYSEFSDPYFPTFGLNIQSKCGKYGPENLEIRTLFTQ